MGKHRTDQMSAQIIYLDSRDESREYYAEQSVAAYFFLDHGDKTYQFSRVHDVSISGLGLYLPQVIAPEALVKVRYHAPDLTLSLNSQVIWCEEADSNKSVQSSCPSYRLGVRHFIDNKSEAMLFFMAIRQHIDDF